MAVCADLFVVFEKEKDSLFIGVHCKLRDVQNQSYKITAAVSDSTEESLKSDFWGKQTIHRPTSCRKSIIAKKDIEIRLHDPQSLT